ncbi:MAG TPA: PaaI family thioesterase [Candidatus Thermoplasmatota archaeon]|nr:PaaI family thioesterase [Candidatus Thermoplasmatota archaeon]
MAHLGATLERLEPGLVEISLPFRKELSQQHGYFHAGVVATIADSAAGYAAFSLMPAGSSVLSIEFKVNLVAPANGERLLARGKVIRSGRTITVCSMEADVEKDGARTACLVGQGTLMCLAGTPDRPPG